MRIFAFLMFIALIIPVGLAQTTWYVDANNPTPPGDGSQGNPYVNIWRAVNSAASSGDTILVMPATYVENLSIVSKSLTMLSSGGAGQTIIDGSNGSASVIDIRNSSVVIIDGFTITNGVGTQHPNGFRTVGGGILCVSSDIEVYNCDINGNRAEVAGGGICCLSQGTVLCSVKIEDNIIHNNYVRVSAGTNPYEKGGGIYLTSCKDNNTILRNNIYNNYTNGLTSGPSWGGGIYVSGSDQAQSVLIEDNTIKDNRSDSGGGILCDVSTDNVLISKNIIESNDATSYGGGIYVESSVQIIDNLVFDNESNGYQASGGGGICCGNTAPQNPVIMNNMIYANVANNGYGGGILCIQVSQARIVNNTIYGNDATLYGGGICLRGNSVTDAKNTIVWNNTAGQNMGPQIALYDQWGFSSTLNIDYSDVQGGQASVFVTPGCTLNWGTNGMINSDPLFVDATNSDFHLTWNSPCRDVGTNNPPVTLPNNDYEGDPRIANNTVDMGADEFYCHLYYSGTPSPGSSITIKTIGIPGKTPVTLYRGSGVLNPPVQTQYQGYPQYIALPILNSIPMGTIPANGVLTSQFTIPSSWVSGQVEPFQVLQGPTGSSSSWLTNLMLIKVN